MNINIGGRHIIPVLLIIADKKQLLMHFLIMWQVYCNCGENCVIISVVDKIKEALSSKLKGQELTLDSNLRDLGIDSLDVVDLIMDLEEELGIEFSDEELMSIHTMKDVCDLIDKKKA